MAIGQDSLTGYLPYVGVYLLAVPMISGRDGHSDLVVCVNSLSPRAIKLGSSAAAPRPRRSHVDAAEPQEDVQRLRKSWTRCHFRFSTSVALEISNHAGLCGVQAIVPRKHAFHTLVHCSRNEELGRTVEIDMRPATSGPLAAFGLTPPNTLSVSVVRHDRLSNRLTGVMFGMSLHHRGGLRPIGRSRLF
jgi:hypothetical protein